MTTIKLMLPELYEERKKLATRKNELETTIEDKSRELSNLKAEYQKILANNFDDPQLEKNYDLQEKAKKSINMSKQKLHGVQSLSNQGLQKKALEVLKHDMQTIFNERVAEVKELILNTETLRAKVREAERQEGLKSIELTSESSEYSRLVDLYELDKAFRHELSQEPYSLYKHLSSVTFNEARRQLKNEGAI
ncbi:hypothetical protein OMY_01389 [Enterococcus sulfureus ATCC 49903]|uniref:Uncharacterized protein n=1 Tax=Enterococcus sulfureus ATCC 49903 TaxID=1140003 RepID=S0L6N2_9ENTE|nr:hypothetical protein [Enterococcus sulfureus]EOT47136.1 hypothetical protein OMY_01389 [Enterococcus sulfureus ATCC 49903]EOT83569.1 hypothetical protein I573_01291 [Enterococcus sulfureus ATCC 49903]